MLYSLNYDRLLHKNFSLRTGIGVFGVGGTLSSGDDSASVRAGMVNIPLLANFLMGHRGHHIEVGAGATLAILYGSAEGRSGSWVGSRVTGSAFEALGTASVGYRYMPPKTGFSFRAGFSPLFAPGLFAPWGYISVGVAF